MKENIYFIGAGGIGMANLVRYCLHLGKRVAGYDRTASQLTAALEREGARICFRDAVEEIPEEFRDPERTLVVYTPAIPDDSPILNWFRGAGHEVVKRAALLGKITHDSKGICIAGSHGKTTTSSMAAHILDSGHVGCNAFLGGILRNNGSNLVLSETSPYSVIEADEYDRSFHQLRPWLAVITSTDADHLDIYGDAAHYVEAFEIFTGLIKPGGHLLLHQGLGLTPRCKDVTVWRYSAHDGGDWHAEEITFGDGSLRFTLCGPEGLRIEDIELGVPVEINVDNAVAAGAAALLAGATEEEVREGLRTFQGAKRRFEFWLKPGPGEEGPILMDDYAHSPNEVKASIESVRKLYPGKKISVIFQPHLYSRTRDFADEFAASLSEADEVILTEIYPAREKPIAGVSSELIYKGVKSGEKRMCERKDLLELIKSSNFEILITLGAADLDVLLPAIKEILSK